MSEEDPKIVARNERKSPQVEKLLRQFLNHDGAKGNTSAYIRGHEFNFSWSQEMRDLCNRYMAEGMTFADAFDRVKEETNGT